MRDFSNFFTKALNVQVGTEAPVNYSARGMGGRGANRIHACQPFKEETRGKRKNKYLVHHYSTVHLQITLYFYYLRFSCLDRYSFKQTTNKHNCDCKLCFSLSCNVYRREGRLR